jgi:hypothetical protein
MSPHVQTIAEPIPFLRSIAVATLMGATILASPFAMAQARDANAPAVEPAQAETPHTHPGTTKMKNESIDQRIENLHAALKITPAEESNWTGVAQVMRDNSAAMEKLVAEKRGTDPKTLTALDDLKTYEQFARAHVDGLKTLSASFETLYNGMPDQQKKIADDVFRNFGQERRRLHG